MPEPLLPPCIDCFQNKSHEEIELARRSKQIDRSVLLLDLVDFEYFD